jgi:HK97 family phage major capsid protein
MDAIKASGCPTAAYDNIISRTDSQALIPEDVSLAMLESLPEQSAVLSLFPRIPVATNQTRLPIISALPTAYFVNGDTGLKQTTEMAWANRYLNVEELAAIVPIPEAVLDDAGFDIWAAVRPRLEEAVGRAIDAAIFFAVNKPASWPAGLVAGAIAAGNNYTRGTNAAAAGGIAEDYNQTFALVEADGYAVNGVIARTTYKSRLRGARGSDGQQLADIQGNTLYGEQLRFLMPGLWPTGSGAAESLVGDFTQGIVGVRQDFTYKLLDQAVIQDNTGAIVYNLAQQDMVALRITFRVGFQVANAVNYEQATEANRWPFGVLRAP